jgi:hypothetical protein
MMISRLKELGIFGRGGDGNRPRVWAATTKASP